MAALGLNSLDILEVTGKLPLQTTAAKTLRQWFRQDLEDGWRRLAAEHGRIQHALDFGSPEDELPLSTSPGS